MAIPLEDIVLDKETSKIISSELAWHYRILPVRTTTEGLELYAEDQQIGKSLQEELEIVLGKKIRLIPRHAADIEKALVSYYIKNTERKEADLPVKFETAQKDFVSVLIQEARLLKSSDIHILSHTRNVAGSGCALMVSWWNGSGWASMNTPRSLTK